MSRKNIVLYHAYCLDGFMSATLLSLYFKLTSEETEFVPVQYGHPIPDVTGKHVYIVDFSYSKEIIESASSVAGSITMLDHHLTAAQQWGGYGRFKCVMSDCCDVSIEIEEHKSGAGLTYAWIMDKLKHLTSESSNVFRGGTGRRIHAVTMAVQDRDLWIKKLDNTEEINEALRMLPRTFDAWEHFLTKLTFGEVAEKIMIAGYCLEMKEVLGEGFASKHQLIDFLGYTVPIVNCPANFASRVCELMYKDYPFSISYCLSTTEVFVSLRSSEATGIDVSEIAKQFKGGGHKHSSGFKIPTSLLYNMLSGQSEFVRIQVNPTVYATLEMLKSVEEKIVTTIGA